MQQMSDIQKAADTLDYIDGSSYETWLKIGMALKNTGCSIHVWETWSRRQANYKAGQCEYKWNTFQTDGQLGIGTLVKLARHKGYKPACMDKSAIINWDSIINDKYNNIVDKQWMDSKDIPSPVQDWENDSIRFINAVFQSNEIVPYTSTSFKNDKQKWIPKGYGIYDQTASDLIQNIQHSSTKDAFSTNDESGAWIRINPFDGEGISNTNVTEYRHTLVESDTDNLTDQYNIIKKLKMPCAAITYSGGKSIHAIIKIDAGTDHDLYKRRVNFVFDLMSKNGFALDAQNKNASRLSRLPGVKRGLNQQYLLETHTGLANYEQWEKYIYSLNDDLPEIECLEAIFNDPPPETPILIEHVLRLSHKMLISAPSKAGKSFLLIQLCVAIAEGTKWLGFQCKQGNVLYINFELDAPSTYNRFKAVYKSTVAGNTESVFVWNLRGKALALNELAPKIISRIQDYNISAVIFDPIYKIMAGDENLAGDVGAFVNQFDTICRELNTSIIYSHHHSKGKQKDRHVADRSSGSGVFARDADVILDFLPLYLNGEEREEVHSMYSYLDKYNFTCWEVATILRDFKRIPKFNMFFNYPVHHIDNNHLLNCYKK